MTAHGPFQLWPRTATRLSYRGLQLCWVRPVWRLAWGSLLLGSMTFLTSCIVADPPQYTNPGQTAPQLNSYLADPPISQVLPVYSNSIGATFSVPVRSEDAGEDLSAVFWEDYGTASPSSRVFNSQRLTAATYGETGRIVTSIPFTVGATDRGCHTVSLIVAHINSFLPSNTQKLDPNKAKSDAAILTWWVNVNPSADALNTLNDCPTQTPAL